MTSRSRSSRSSSAITASRRRCARSQTRPPSSHGVAFDVDIAEHDELGDDRRDRALHDRPRAGRPGPAPRAADARADRRSPASRRRRRRDGRRRRRAGAPPPHPRDDRGARAPAPRHARGERAGRRHRDERHASRRTPRGNAGELPSRRWPTRAGTRPRGHVLFLWSPSGYRTPRRDGEPPAVGTELARGGPRARRDEGRPLAAPGRPSPLRLHRRQAAGDGYSSGR